MDIFERVVCAVDGTLAGSEAVRQAATLAPPEAGLCLLTVVSEAELDSEWGKPYDLSPGAWHAQLEPALRGLVGDREIETQPVFHSGPPAVALVEELRSREATLVALGGRHRHRRLTGVLLGSVAVNLLHDAPCSLLIARLDEGRPRQFRSLAVGYDGSPQALAALEVARELAGRVGASLSAIVADGAAPPDEPGVTVRKDPRAAVDALHDVDCDLLVVGSRGLHGIAALGSVSERVANTVPASVLVVRNG